MNRVLAKYDWPSGQYVVTDTGSADEWYSYDGDEWVDQTGRLVESTEFNYAIIVFADGPLAGKEVA
jgi:hypothetical protein